VFAVDVAALNTPLELARACSALCVTAHTSRGALEGETFHDQFDSLVLEWTGSVPK
jgi:hypothetical protein